MVNWHNLRYLQAGNARQQHAYAVLQAAELCPRLAQFGPVLAGTIPLGIDIPGSDLDVLCEVPPAAQSHFRQLLAGHYGHLPGFRLAQRPIGGHDSIICNFFFDGTEIEVFGQAVPTAQQFGFRHLLVEYAVLEAGGEPWRQAVQQLKRQGMKTEPAFAKLLRLAGDPYEALLTLEGKSQSELAEYLPSLVLSIQEAKPGEQ